MARIHYASKGFREQSEILTRNDVSLKLKGKVYVICVKSAMVYGSETWVMNAEQIGRFEWTEIMWCVSEG